MPSVIVRHWKSFWFHPVDTFALEVLRIGLGLGILVSYGVLTPDLDCLFGTESPISLELARELGGGLNPLLLTSPGQLYLFHGVFLAAALCLTVGYQVRWVKWIVWLFHLAYFDRNPAAIYGADYAMASFLLLLCLAPVGRALSLDSVRHAHGPREAPSEFSAEWATACLRLAQIQLVVIYFSSGVQKLGGDHWWAGDALWLVLVNPEFTSSLAPWAARHFSLVRLLTYGAVTLEVGYAFLVLNPTLRLAAVAGVTLLHFGIAAVLGLRYFSWVMIVANLVMLDPARLRAGALRFESWFIRFRSCAQ